MSQNGVPDPFQSSRRSEGTMELFIETLTGTAFEMTVSPFDTIISIKTKIQRVEGIPVSQQHLLYNFMELEDSSSLMDHSIQNGATLKLVLSLRGGPISTRRVHSEEEMSWKELRDLMEQNISEPKRDDVLDYLPPGCRVTVLVLREGDQVNLFRVLENENGTYSPLSDTLSSSSIQSVYLEGEQEKPHNDQRQYENTVTMFKMQELKKRMEALSLSKKPKKNTPPLLSAKRPLGPSLEPLGSTDGVPRIPTLALNQGEPDAACEACGSSEVWNSPFPETLHLPPIQKAETTMVPSRQRAITCSYLRNSSMMNDQPPRRSRETDRRASGKYDNNLSHPRPILGTSRREIKTPSHSRRPPLVPLCPSKRSGARRRTTANANLDARPRNCVDYGINRTLYRHKPSTESASEKDGKPESSSLVSTSKISLVEPDSESAIDKVESDFRVNPSSIQVPDPASEATTTTYAIARERVTTSVGGTGRYRLSEVVLSADDEDDEDHPKTSSDKITPQKCTQELCNILSETKWHRRQQQMNCPAIDDLSNLTQGSQQPALIKARSEQEELPLDLAMPDCSILDGPLLGTPSLLQYSQRGLLLPLMNDNKGTEHQSLTNIDEDESRPHHGARRRVPSEQIPSNRDAKTLPLIVPEGKKVRQRCAECRKRLKLTTMYTCRCEKLFCAAHRYSELHDCTFDYKTEGRKLLEQSNPLVTAPKLPKI